MKSDIEIARSVELKKIKHCLLYTSDAADEL